MQRFEYLSDLASVIVEIPLDHPTRVAIDGVDGVGKTTLADELVPLIQGAGRQVIRASVDGFHNPEEQRYRRGPSSAEGYFRDSFNYPDLRSKLLEPLGPGGSRRFRTAIFDYREDTSAQTPLRIATASDVLLFDGVFLLRPELKRCWDFAVWVEAPFEITVERAVKRDSREPAVTPIRVRYERRYVPGQRLYLDECGPKEQADVVFNNTDLSHPEVQYRKIERAV